MNNPQTPIEAAIKAYDDASDYGYSDKAARACILAFLQWFENEPDEVSKVIEDEYGDSAEGKLKASKAAKEVIQHLKSMVK